MTDMPSNLVSYAETCARQRVIELCKDKVLTEDQFEDCLQDILVDMVKAWKGFNPKLASEKTFIDRISFKFKDNYLRKYARAFKRRLFVEVETDTEGSYNPQRVLNLRLDLEEANYYISCTSVLWTYLLRFVSKDEIPKIAGISRMTLHNYLKKTRTELISQGIGEYVGLEAPGGVERGSRMKMLNKFKKEMRAIYLVCRHVMYTNGLRFVRGLRKLPVSVVSPPEVAKQWQSLVDSELLKPNEPVELSRHLVRKKAWRDWCVNPYLYMMVMEYHILLDRDVVLTEAQSDKLLEDVYSPILYETCDRLEEKYYIGEDMMRFHETYRTHEIASFYCGEDDDFLLPLLLHFRVEHEAGGMTWDDYHDGNWKIRSVVS